MAIAKALETAETDELKEKLTDLLDETKRELKRLELSSVKRKAIARDASIELVTAMNMGTKKGICDTLIKTIQDNR